jgi:hypothetical protein
MQHSAEYQGILGQAQHSSGSPSAFHITFGPLQLLPLPQAEEHSEGDTISRRRRNTTEYDTAVASHSEKDLPDMH